VIKLKRDFKIQKVEKKDTSSELTPKQGDSTFRPEVVNAKVYKVKSAFVKNAVFITLSYVDTHTGREPIEIFINSKDLNRSAEYVVLTRLISAIFRRASDPMFILEELHGIHDPNGGSFKDGKYFHSFYAEVADVIERFFYDVNILSSKDKESSVDDNIQQESVKVPVQTKDQETDFNKEFRICPTCSGKSLKTENGCDMCVECGYSKCDK
tara:strand:+ start:91019 stop:91651 length:633 start_codon:yes stop_codon:yes gene_type:complete